MKELYSLHEENIITFSISYFQFNPTDTDVPFKVTADLPPAGLEDVAEIEINLLPVSALPDSVTVNQIFVEGCVHPGKNFVYNIFNYCND